MVLDPAERRRRIAADAATLAADLGLMLRADEGLLEEVAAGRQESMADLRSDLAGLTRAIKQTRRDA